MASTLPDNYLPFFSVQEALIRHVATLSAMYFAYGLYVLLFGICIYMMCSRDQTGGRRNKNLYLILTVVLFALSTIFVVNQTAYYVHAAIIRFNIIKNKDQGLLERYQDFNDFERRLGGSTEQLLSVFLNIAAEWMLIHRCCLIWGSNKMVAIPLIMASILINAWGLVSYTLESIGTTNFSTTHSLNAVNLLVIATNFQNGYFIASLVNNITITLLTAGRIWWIHRQVRAQGGYTSDKLVQQVFRFILESGIIYPIIATVDLITTSTISFEEYSFDVFPLAALSAGIAPTLIMVRAKLGQNIESLQEAVSDIRFTSQPARQGTGGINLSTTQSEAQVLSIVRNSSVFEGGEEDAQNVKEASGLREGARRQT